MGLRDLYIFNTDDEVHLRDARHAHQLFNEYNFAYAPKTKFLYHLVFTLSDGIADRAANSTQFSKQIGVLAKSVDLPKYISEVETVQQYNRKKKVQTSIKYQDVQLIFHDDNTGVTRSMLEEYYTYYFRDGLKNNNGDVIDYSPTDKFSTEKPPRYGLDNETEVPFFKNIKIFHLSRHQWFSYTLINPLVSNWGHDRLEYGDGAGLMENTLTVEYEAVLYNYGDIEQNTPPGFTDEETRYDVVHSPLDTLESNYDQYSVGTGVGREVQPKIIPQTDILSDIELFTPVFQNQSRNSAGLISRLAANPSINQVSELQQLRFPKTNTQEIASLSSALVRGVQNLSGDRIRETLTNNVDILNSVVNRVLATGSYSSDFNSNNFSNFENLSETEKTAIRGEIIERAAGTDKKVQQIASDSISKAKTLDIRAGGGAASGSTLI